MHDMTAATIQVWINQISTELNAPATLSDAIAAADLKPPFAAAVNMQFVPKKNHSHHLLQAGDKIELIVPVTGG
jgi:sulfur carrier protein